MKNKRLLFAQVILLLLIPVSIGLYLRMTDKEKGFEDVDQEVINPVQGSNSAYYSKLEAYKEKERAKRNQSNVSVRMDGDLFSNQDVEEEVRNVKQAPPVAVPQKVSEKPQGKRSTAFSQLSEVAKVKNEQAVAQEVLEESTDISQSSRNERERRLQEMKSSWGNKSSAGSSKKSGYYQAVVHGTQELRSGQTVVLRTKDGIRHGDIDIPANTLLNGILAIRNNRAEIKIASARVNNQVFQVQLQVYGMDGIPGLALDQSAVSSETTNQITREAANEARKYGVAGKIAGAVVSAVTREKKQTIILVDAQNLLFK
ncbi:MAG: conjugative transposon protein TraM [Bacteroidales bacterium]